MKTLVSLLLSLLAFSAQAEQINLLPSGCDANRNCQVIANDAGVPISIHANIGSYKFYLSVDGVMYEGQNNPGDINQVACDTSNVCVQVYVQFHHWTTKQSSGRGGGYYTQHYSILGGHVIR